ncbi:MAG: hypothetical protein AB8I08_08575 [Sandaracinaceae bacterium]
MAIMRSRDCDVSASWIRDFLGDTISLEIGPHYDGRFVGLLLTEGMVVTTDISRGEVVLSEFNIESGAPRRTVLGARGSHAAISAWPFAPDHIAVVVYADEPSVEGTQMELFVLNGSRETVIREPWTALRDFAAGGRVSVATTSLGLAVAAYGGLPTGAVRGVVSLSLLGPRGRPIAPVAQWGVEGMVPEVEVAAMDSEIAVHFLSATDSEARFFRCR